MRGYSSQQHEASGPQHVLGENSHPHCLFRSWFLHCCGLRQFIHICVAWPLVSDKIHGVAVKYAGALLWLTLRVTWMCYWALVCRFYRSSGWRASFRSASFQYPGEHIDVSCAAEREQVAQLQTWRVLMKGSWRGFAITSHSSFKTILLVMHWVQVPE